MMTTYKHPPTSGTELFRTVYGTFPYADGAGKPPAIEFNPNVALSNDDGLLTTMEPYRIPLAPDGSFSVDLLTCDGNQGVLPNGWCWAVREDWKGGRFYWIVLKYDQGGPISISHLAPVPSRPPMVGVTGGPQGKRGDPGPDGERGEPGAFTAWIQPVRPDTGIDPVTPGDLWMEGVV